MPVDLDVLVAQAKMAEVQLACMNHKVYCETNTNPLAVSVLLSCLGGDRLSLATPRSTPDG